MAEGLDVQECVTLQTDVRRVSHPADKHILIETLGGIISAYQRH